LEDAQVPALERITRFVREQVAPSAEAFDAPYTVPEALSAPAIAEVIAAFAAAATRARVAGFQVIEIHAAHGYLLHEFLSPVANKRTDAWGGSFDGRTRLVREVARAIRRVWPDDRPLLTRLSTTDWLGNDGTAGTSKIRSRFRGY
jgi:2,4-dienoyl-CoA reductase-like NADH-dependent reductase (Old Yellow Enzyme family)